MGFPEIVVLPERTPLYPIRTQPERRIYPPGVGDQRYEVIWSEVTDEPVEKLTRFIFEAGDRIFEVIDIRKFNNGRHRAIVRPVQAFETVASQVRRGNLITWSFSSQRVERDYSYQRLDRIRGRVATIREDENFLDGLTRTRIELLGAEDHGPFYLERNTKVTVLDGREYTDD